MVQHFWASGAVVEGTTLKTGTTGAEETSRKSVSDVIMDYTTRMEDVCKHSIIKLLILTLRY